MGLKGEADVVEGDGGGHWAGKCVLHCVTPGHDLLIKTLRGNNVMEDGRAAQGVLKEACWWEAAIMTRGEGSKGGKNGLEGLKGNDESFGGAAIPRSGKSRKGDGIDQSLNAQNDEAGGWAALRQYFY